MLWGARAESEQIGSLATGDYMPHHYWCLRLHDINIAVINKVPVLLITSFVTLHK